MKFFLSALLGFSQFAFSLESVIHTGPASNGMDTVLVQEPKVPLVTIVLVVKAGAMTETRDISGLTHLWEHMFFKGNARIPNQEAFSKRIRQLGINYNGDTSPEMVRYYFTLPSQFLEEGIQFMSDAIATPLLDQKELERERHVVMDEYDRNASRPTFDSHNLQRILIFGSEEHQRNPLGRRFIIEKTTREQLLRIKKEVFVPHNSALVVVGDLEVEKTRKMIDKHFAKWTTPHDWHPPKQNALPDFPKKSIEYVMVRPLVQTPQVAITFDGPLARSNPKDTFAADALGTMIGSRTSQFYKKFVDSGLALNATLGYFTQSQSGEVSYMAAAEPSKVVKLKQAMLEEIPHLAKPDYFTNEQLKNAQKQLRIQHKHEVNKPSEYAKNLAFWWAITGIPYYQNYLSEIDKVTLEDVRNFVEKYLHNKSYVSAIVLSPEAAKEAKLEDTSKPLVEKHLKNYLTKFD